MSQPSLDAVQKALDTVIDPTFGKPMTGLGTAAEACLRDGRIELEVTLPTPSASLRDEVARRIRQALEPVGAPEVQITGKVRIPAREVGGDDPMPDVRNVILVMSGKGGVGKSTCATNLALALSGAGARVGLLDTDIYGPSLPTMMGVCSPLHSEDGKTIQPLEAHGIKVMSIGFMLEDPKAAIVWRGPMLHGVLGQFLSDVRWGELDYLVLDLPPGTGDVAISVAQKLKTTGVVMVTTPQEVALQDVYKGVSMCEKLKLPVLGVIENMSHFVDPAGIKHELFGSGGGQAVAEYAKAPLLGQVPMEPAVREAGDSGTPVVSTAPDSAAAREFVRIADDLAARIAVLHFKRGGGEKAPTTSGPRRLRVVG